MNFDQFEKASSRQLKAEAKWCFDLSKNEYSYPNPVDRMAVLLESQFYMQELDRRHDNWVAWRDLLLEVVVIVLIGGEIWLGWKQGKDVYNQTTVLQSLNQSASATATTLQLLQVTMETMLYEPSVSLLFDAATKQLKILNQGRSTISILTMKYDKEATITLTPPQIIAQNTDWFVAGDQAYKSLYGKVSNGEAKRVPLTFEIANEVGKHFVLHGTLVGAWIDGQFTVFTQTQAITKK
jgi:hypothetical protein